MKSSRKNVFFVLFHIFAFAALFWVHYNGLFKLSSLHANPMIILAFLVAFSMFATELQAALVGLGVGIFADAFSSSGSVFHTLLFFILATVISVLVHYVLNNNFRCALMLIILSSACYYLFRWLFCYAFTESVNDSAGYIMLYALPSVIYTSLFIIPFYFLEKKVFSKIRN